jgi:YidC/Oxa1 family membrane protein insertase
MEKRAVLAALLMAGLLILYQFLFVKAPETPPQGAQGQRQAAPVVPAQPGSAVVGSPPPMPVPSKEPPTVLDRKAVVETPLYRAVIDSRGARFETWTLHYRGEKPMVVNGVLGAWGLTVSRGGVTGQPVAFSVSAESLKLGADTPEGEIKLTGEDGFGLRITETLRFRADSYVVEHVLRVENRHTVAQSAEINLGWRVAAEWPKDEAQKFQGQHPIRTVRLAGGAVRREDVVKVAPYQGMGQWVGLESDWYLTAFIPQGANIQLTEAKPTESRPGMAKPAESAEVGLRASPPLLGPGESWEGRVLTYIGPKEYVRLKALNVGLEKSIYFGGFPLPQTYGGLPMEWLAVPILQLMHWIYAYTGNYGIAIILLTVLTKVLFFPLTIKSMTSMKAMQALQPQINALRSKYKSDSQRMQQETMALYRTHKVNPLGGCLPMVVQIPIFYALYVALSVSVELQNQPFICIGRVFGMDLWICDMAAQDPTYVLPLLMGASMFVQQKITPVMGDPRQAKMMLFMPIVFTFMFLNLPAGLVLYWTLSNVLQIAQQKYMEQRGKAEKVPARAAKKA